MSKSSVQIKDKITNMLQKSAGLYFNYFSIDGIFILNYIIEMESNKIILC